MKIVERKPGQMVELEKVVPGTVIYFDGKYWLRVNIEDIDIDVIDLVTGAPNWIDYETYVEEIPAKLYIN